LERTGAALELHESCPGATTLDHRLMTSASLDFTSAIDTLRTALHFRDTLDYPAIVALCDPASIESLFQDYRENVRPLTRADLQVRHPHLSDAQIALAERSEPRAQLERDRQIAFRLPETSGYADLEQLSASEFLRRYLAGGSDVRRVLLRALQSASRPVPDWLVQPPPGLRYEIISAEATDANTVRICYREVWEAHGVANVMEACEQLRLDGTGRWRLLAHHDLLEPVGARGSIIPDEFADLFPQEPAS
jgi:hypothetical protein